ncbi:hypothetical protein D3C72_1912660 [compost metagenome]
MFVNNRWSGLPEFVEVYVLGFMPVDAVLKCSATAMKKRRFSLRYIIDKCLRFRLQFRIFGPNSTYREVVWKGDFPFRPQKHKHRPNGDANSADVFQMGRFFAREFCVQGRSMLGLVIRRDAQVIELHKLGIRQWTVFAVSQKDGGGQSMSGLHIRH